VRYHLGKDWNRLIWQTMKRRLPGFSLIEVALALIILGLVTSLTLPLITNLLTLEAQRKTDQHQQQITAALASYVLQHHRLPCPAESPSSGISLDHCHRSLRSCVGYVPYKTLGLPEAVAKDGRKKSFLYAVNPELTEIMVALGDTTSKNFCDVQHSTLTIETIEIPQGDCLAFILAPFAELPISLDFPSPHQFPIFWITRNNLLAHYAKRPCTKSPNRVMSQQTAVPTTSQPKLNLFRHDF
jgi:prepilin-type N-terminal cleavage/methylation domain-containing protein